ncbi:MAG: hypothetical protein NT090_16310, partial [Acidobacteria bacterium]|nr:hypothetical protein [Acidobacteriota bacterium]
MIAIAKQSGVYLLKALLVWLGVFFLIALMSFFRFWETMYPFTIGLARFVKVLWPCLLAFVVVVLILTAFRSDGVLAVLAASIQWSAKTAAILLAVAAVIVGLIAAVATFESQDPWRYLPGGPPFGMREFARQHPDLRVTDWGSFGVAVEDRESNRVIFSVWDLREAALSWEKWADASEPARLGGPPPFPGSKSLLRIRITRPDYDALSDEEADRDAVPPQLHRTIYVYSIGWIGADKVEEHFRGWIKSAGLEGNYSHYQTNLMEVEVSGGKWSISVVGQRKQPKDIYVEYTER